MVRFINAEAAREYEEFQKKQNKNKKKYKPMNKQQKLNFMRRQKTINDKIKNYYNNNGIKKYI